MVLAGTSGSPPAFRRGRPHTLREQPPTPGSKTLLVVDDDPDLLRSLGQLLESQPDGFRVVAARSGTRALDVLQTQPVDLVLADYRMGAMNGVDFLRAARARAPTVPRCLMTAYPDLKVAIDAVNEGGITRYFQKPFQPESLVDGLRQVLEEARQGQERRRGVANAHEVPGRGP